MILRAPWGKRESLLRSVRNLAFYNERGVEIDGHDEAEADAVRKQLIDKIEKLSERFISEELPPQFANWLTMEAFRVSNTSDYLGTLEGFFKSRGMPGGIEEFAFSWIGPAPHDGEHLSDFKFRRVVFALIWALAFIVILGALYLLSSTFPSLEQNGMWLASLFAAIIGLGMAVLGAMALTVSWMKTRIFGRDAR